MSDYRNHPVYIIIVRGSKQFILLNSDITCHIVGRIYQYNSKIEDNSLKCLLIHHIQVTIDKTEMSILHIYKISSYIDENVTLLLCTIDVAKAYPKTKVDIYLIKDGCCYKNDYDEENRLSNNDEYNYGYVTIITPIYNNYDLV
jgi:hypothetical protein